MGESFNYFNYYTEIEEYFWRKRGQSLLVSTLDWAIIESWQKAGVPLEVVFKGIDRAFEKYDAKKRGRPIKSLAYCVDAVADAAEEAREAAAGRGPSSGVERPAAFEPGEVVRFLEQNARAVRKAAAPQASNPVLEGTLTEIAEALEGLAGQPASGHAADLEDLERHMTALEEKVQAALIQALPTEQMVELRREIDRGLGPYRRRMKPEQVAMIESQFLQKKMFEHFGVPRLSLFYLTASQGAE